MNNKIKEQNIELLELKHMGVIHAKLERKNKKQQQPRPGQAGPKSLGHKPKYSWQISMLPDLSMQTQWELSTKAQTTKHQSNHNNFALIPRLWHGHFISPSFANANISKHLKIKRKGNLFGLDLHC